MDNVWEGFSFPGLEEPGTEDVVGTVIPETPPISDVEGILVKRAMVVFFVIDISGSMKNERIGSVNDAIRNLLPELKKKEASNTNAEIKVAILTFSSNADWKTITPQTVSNFVYDDITYVGGATNFGKAFAELNGKLSRSKFLSAAAGSYMPLIICLTDGKPSDPALYPEELVKLRHNAWFNFATKAAIIIGADTMPAEDKQKCRKVMIEFTGNESMVLESRDANTLTKKIELVTLTGVDFVTQQGSLQNTGTNAQPSEASNFGSTMGGAPQNINQNPNQNATVGQNTAQNQGSGQAAPPPAVDVTAGVDPVIPNLQTIDFDNDFNF